VPSEFVPDSVTRFLDSSAGCALGDPKLVSDHACRLTLHRLQQRDLQGMGQPC
jgi:hypothetical protein